MKMKSEENDLLEMLQKNREIELTNVKMVQEKEERFKSAGVRLTLYQIRMDSAKHAQIYQTLIDLIKEGTTKYCGTIASTDTWGRLPQIEYYKNMSN